MTHDPDTVEKVAQAIMDADESTAASYRCLASAALAAMPATQAQGVSVNRVQHDDNGDLDEVVTDGSAHLEHLGGENWFLCMTRADTSEFCVWFSGKITLTEEREPLPPVSKG